MFIGEKIQYHNVKFNAVIAKFLIEVSLVFDKLTLTSNGKAESRITKFLRKRAWMVIILPNSKYCHKGINS